MGAQKKRYDVRAIRYIKTRFEVDMNGDEKVLPTEGTVQEHCEKNNGEFVFCLSHFDYLVFDRLYDGDNDSRSPLTVIDEDRRMQALRENNEEMLLKEDNYTYPLYMLLDISDSHVKDNVLAFWDTKSDYTSVIRIHYSYGKGEEQHLGAEYFVNQINKNIIDREVHKVSTDNNILPKYEIEVPDCDGSYVRTEFHYLVYDSLELGDCVVILKADSLVGTLTFARLLNDIACVLDSYTYIGINPTLFKNDAQKGEKNRDSISLESASTRFTVKQLREANEFFSDYYGEEEIEFITGTTDARICWKKTSQSDSLSEEFFLEQISKLDPNRIHFHKAFRDVITRTGIQWNRESNNGAMSKQQLSEEYIQLFIQPSDESAVNWFIYPDKNFKYLPNWLRSDKLLFLSLKKLLEAIRTMGKDGVMDALANLLIPSMRALFSRIYELSDKKWKLEYKQEIEELLRDYFSLIQDISQLESQLVQHPEIYPAPYYIPAAVLQFELQFTRLCSELFLDKHCGSFREGKRYTFYPVIVPSYQSDTSTMAPLDPCRTKVYANTVEPISPLRTYLPIRLLYRPYIAAHQLCHEIAHYCGDNARQRGKRFDALCTCGAAMLMTTWEEMLEDETCELDWENSQIIRELHALQDRIKASCEGVAPDYYLTEVVEQLREQVRIIGLDPRYYEHFHNILFLNAYKTQLDIMRARIIIQRNQVSQLLSLSDYWYQHIAYLEELCKECYADIAMLKLLDCNAETYYECVKVSFEELEKEYESQDAFLSYIFTASNVKLHIDRLAFVIYSMGNKFLENAENSVQTPPLWFKRSLEQARTLEAKLKKKNVSVSEKERNRWNGDQRVNSTMTQIERKAIASYLGQCANALDQKMKKINKGKLTDLRTALLATSTERFDWTAVQEFVWKVQYGNGDGGNGNRNRDKKQKRSSEVKEAVGANC